MQEFLYYSMLNCLTKDLYRYKRTTARKKHSKWKVNSFYGVIDEDIQSTLLQRNEENKEMIKEYKQWQLKVKCIIHFFIEAFHAS